MNIKSTASTYCPLFLRPAFNRIINSPIGYRLASGVFWSMAGAVISRGLMLAAWVLVARMLGKTGYGELGMIQSTVGMFGIFAGFGLGLTATKHVAEYRQSDPHRAGQIISLSGMAAMTTGCLMALCLLIFAPWFAEHTINAPHLAGVLRIGGLILFINALNGAQTGALAGFEAFRSIAYVNLFVGLISFPILIGGAYFGGLTGAVLALVVNLGFNWLFNHLALRKEARRYNVPFTFKHCTRELSILWKFSLPAVLSGALVGPVVWVCNSILVNQENGYAALGIYSAAFQISIIIATANSMIGQAFLPICISLLNNNNKIFDYINFVLPWGIGIFCALPFLCVPELWAILLGADYFGKSILRTIVYVSISSIIIAHRQGIARNFIARNYLWWSLFGNSFWGITAIICTYCLRYYGEQGMAISFVIAYTLNTIIFIPLYIHFKLCSKHLLLSYYSILIWVTLILLTAMVPLINLGIYFRCAILLPAYFVIFKLFQMLWSSRENGLKGEPYNVE